MTQELALSTLEPPALFDGQVILKLAGGDTDFVRELVSILQEDGPRLLEQMALAVARGEAQPLRLAAHALHGSAAHFRAARVQQAARALEVMGRNGDLSRAPETLTALQEALWQLYPALQQFVLHLTSDTRVAS